MYYLPVLNVMIYPYYCKSPNISNTLQSTDAAMHEQRLAGPFVFPSVCQVKNDTLYLKSILIFTTKL